MALQTKDATKIVTAENEVKGFNVKYRYEQEPGKQPQYINGRAEKEGTNVVHEVNYFPETGMVTTTTHYSVATTDFHIINAIVNDLYEIAAGVTI